MAVNAEVSRLEVSVASNTEKAINNLTALANKLDSLASVITNVVDKAGGLATIGKVDTGNIRSVLTAAKELSRSFKDIEKKKPDIVVRTENIAKANQILDEFRDKMKGSTNLDLASRKEDVPLQIKLWEQGLAKVNKQFIELAEQGGKALRGKAFKTAIEAVVNYENAIKRATIALQDWEAYEASLPTGSHPEFEPGLDDGITNSAVLVDTANAIEDVTAAEEDNLSTTEALIATKNHETHILMRLKSIYRGLQDGTKVATASLRGFIRVTSALANPLKVVSNAAKKFQTAMGLGGHGGLFGGRRTFGQFLGLMLLRRAIMSMIRALVSGIKEGSDNLARYSADYNRSISSMSSGLKYLKNAWAAAFAPIVNVVAPYITAFINMLASALNAVGRFLAALTGKGFAVQAKPVWQDYAASLDGAAAGSDKAAKAAKEYQKTLMSFDQVHALNSPDKSSGGSGRGGGSGSDGLSVQDMFTTVSVEGAMKGFADKLREAAQNGNWESVGQIIAEKLNESLSNKAVWQNLGKKIGDSFNIAIDTFYGFVKKFDFGQFGTDVGSAIGTALKTIHWANLGGGIGRFATGLFEFLTNLMKEVDWKQLGEDIKTGISEFFKELKWDSIGEFVFTAFDSLLDFCIGIMPDFGEVGDYILNAIGDFFDNVPESKVLAIAAKLALFLLKCIENMAKWKLYIPNKIIESIFGVDVIDKAFGSIEGKLDKEIQGLESGERKGLFGSAADWLFGKTETMRQSIADFFGGANQTIQQYSPMLQGNMLQAGKGAWDAFTKWINEKNGKTAGDGAVSGAGEGINGKSTWLNKTIGKVSGAAAKLFNIGSSTKKSGESSITSFGKGTTGKQSWIVSTVKSLFKNVGSQFNINSLASTHGSSSMTYFANGANAKKTSVSSTIKSLATTVGAALNINTPANTYGSAAITNFSNGAVGKKASVTSIITSIATAAKNALNISTAANTHGRNIGASYANGIKGAKNSVSNAGTMLSNAVSGTLSSNAYSKGYSYGSSLSRGLSAGFKSTSLPKVNYNINYTYVNGNRIPTSMSPYTSYVKPYALGGFLNSGELFVARENGLTEMVGRIGNRGAVANNQQIVEGIEAGVAKGMMAALSATNMNANNAPYEVHITVKTQNDEVLARAVDRGNAQRRYRLGTATA